MEEKAELVSDTAAALEAFLSDRYGISVRPEQRVPFMHALIVTLGHVFEKGREAGRKQEPSEN